MIRRNRIFAAAATATLGVVAFAGSYASAAQAFTPPPGPDWETDFEIDPCIVNPALPFCDDEDDPDGPPWFDPDLDLGIDDCFLLDACDDGDDPEGEDPGEEGEGDPEGDPGDGDDSSDDDSSDSSGTDVPDDAVEATPNFTG